MSVLIAVDKFKGSLTQSEISEVISEFMSAQGVESSTIPLADGGDGSIAALISLGWQRKTIKVNGPLANEHDADYAISPDGKKVAIEVAELCGIKYLKGRTNPWQASSAAIGAALKVIKPINYEEILVCVGGSASVDGGIGILQALGISVFDDKHNSVSYGLNGLQETVGVDFESVDLLKSNLFGSCKITILSDTKNPLLGSSGAIFAFGKQKGLNSLGRLRAEIAMRRWFKICQRHFPQIKPNTEGTGGAGGIGFIFKTFFDAQVTSGAEFFLTQSKAEEKIQQASLLITGEGRIDKTTLSGKGVHPLLGLAQKHQVPVVLICGSAEAATMRKIKSNFQIIGVVCLADSGLEMSHLMSNASQVLKQELSRKYSRDWK